MLTRLHRQILILPIIALIMIRCSGGSTSTPETAAESTPSTTEKSFALSDLSGEWHMLTQQNGDWVLYYPCDADNTFVQVKGDSIVIGWGQDATLGIIESWTLSDLDELSLVVNDSYTTTTYRVQQTEDGLTQWWLQDDVEGPSYFTHVREKDLFRTIKQPCKECWEDCEEE